MLTSRGWSSYRAEQEMKKRFRSRAARKGWTTRRRLAAFDEEILVGYKSCSGLPGKPCSRQVRRDNADGRCGTCWSALAAQKPTRK